MSTGTSHPYEDEGDVRNPSPTGRRGCLGDMNIINIVSVYLYACVCLCPCVFVCVYVCVCLITI